jgi:hypothetical protein
MLAGTNPVVIIKAGGSVRVKGYEGDAVHAKTSDAWGLQLEKRSPAEVGRARAAIGERVLFDVRLKRPVRDKSAPEEAIAVQLGGSGEVVVPSGSELKVYAGKSIEIEAISGRVDAYAGHDLKLQNVAGLGHASAGWSMEIDCKSLNEEEAEFKSGRDLRFHVHDLTSARVRVKDLGGYWEARIGEGRRSVYLKCGGDVTLVTDQKVEALPPDYILGKIEKPAPA